MLRFFLSEFSLQLLSALCEKFISEIKSEIMFKNRMLFFLFFSLWVILNSGCEDTSDNCGFYDHPVEKYTQVDINQNVKSTDDNDWRTSPKYSGAVTVKPAFPNSNGGRTIITVPVIIYDIMNGQLSNIGIIGQNDQGQWVNIQTNLTTDNSTPDPGAYNLEIDLTKLSSTGKLSDIKGLKRIYVIDDYLNTDLCSSIVSYGDLQITP